MLSLILAAALSAPAVDPATEADLRCIALFAISSGKAPEDKKPGLAAGLLFFLGRIDARSPGFDLEANLRRVMLSETQASLQADAARCGPIIESKGKLLTEIGQRMMADSKKQ
jgi:hypothetical protein